MKPGEAWTVEAMVEALAAASSPGGSKSRRDGHRPRAREHLEAYALAVAYGLPARAIAARRGVKRSAAYDSIAVGRKIAARAAQRGALDGFSDPGGREPGLP